VVRQLKGEQADMSKGKVNRFERDLDASRFANLFQRALRRTRFDSQKRLIFHRRALYFGLIAICLSAPTLAAEKGSDKQQRVGTTPGQWWEGAVFYEIFPRSYKDTNGDGIGDLNGITSRLDYLKDLGVDAIWITPCFPSPLVDFGYDVSDYRTIAPEFGTLADFDRLIAEAKKRDIHVLLDLVVNHTSNQHPWFQESSSSLSNPKRDWYIWRSGDKAGLPPNNWQSGFLTPAWTFSRTTHQWYYHAFWAEQPDLNWRNPEVRKAMYDVMRFWLQRGVAGFRLDAVPSLFEDPSLRDDPNSFDKLPETHQVLREMHDVTREFPGDRVLLGETYTKDDSELAPWYGNGDELHLALNFPFDLVNKVSASEYRKRLADNEAHLLDRQPTLFLSSHDEPRAFDRFGDRVHNDAIAKLMAALQLTARGTPVIYYGDEIGMKTTTPERKENVKDTDGLRNWPKKRGRDGERTPMQWTDEFNAGFSSGTPWLPIPVTAKTHNVATESRDPDSVLTFYRSLLKLRHDYNALRSGAYIPLDGENPTVLSFARTGNGTTPSIVVILNMSATDQVVSLKRVPGNTGEALANTLLRSRASERSDSTPGKEETSNLHSIHLVPFEAWIGQLIPDTSAVLRH
jgi:alpha-glucosidase